MDSRCLDFPLQAVAIKSHKSTFRSENGEVYYEKAGSYFVVAGDPVAYSASKEKVFSEFEQWVKTQSGKICGYYFSEGFCPENYQKVYAGSSSIIDLQSCRLDGKNNREIRRAFNQARRFNLKFVELSSPVGADIQLQVMNTYFEWLSSKRAPVIRFLLSPPNLTSAGRFFAVYEKEQVRPSAFVSIYKYRDGYYLDDMIQRPCGHRFALDFLISQLMFLLKEEGEKKLSLGFNAFDRVRGHDSLTRLLSWVGRFRWPYNSSGIRSYKKKFNGSLEDRFLLLDKKSSRISQINSMISVTYRGRRLHYSML